MLASSLKFGFVIIATVLTYAIIGIPLLLRWLVCRLRDHLFSLKYRRELLFEFGLFNDRGIGLINANRLDLEHVYVDLSIASDISIQDAHLSPIAERIRGRHSIWHFVSAFREGIVLAVVGAPGSGKTTLLHHILLVFSRNRRFRYSRKIRQRIPVFLELRVISEKAGASGRLPPLDVVIANHLRTNFKDAGRMPNGWVTRNLKRGAFAILLDGLDEVADPARRESLSRWIDVEVMRDANRRCLAVLTSRPNGYRQAPLERAQVLEVQPFAPHQVHLFVYNWYRANETISSGERKQTHETQRRADKRANALLETLKDNPALNDLTRNPLLLTMMTMVHRYRGALPGSRVQLYSEICEVLLERWRQARGIIDHLRGDQKLMVLRPLAAHMMRTMVRDISHAAAVEVITPCLERVGIVDEARLEFLPSLQSTSGLVLEKEQGQWCFAHQSLQEFLAASALLEDPESVSWSSVVKKSWWRETMLLYAAQSEGTDIINSALDAATPESLALVYDCLRESRALCPQTRKRAEEHLRTALSSSDVSEFRPAAEALLLRRNLDYCPIDDRVEISRQFVSQAEFRLFLLAAGDARAPAISPHPEQEISGISPQEATDFCAWLDERFVEWKHRLPTKQEEEEHFLGEGSVAAWCCGDHFEIGPLPDSIRGHLEKWCADNDLEFETILDAGSNVVKEQTRRPKDIYRIVWALLVGIILFSGQLLSVSSPGVAIGIIVFAILLTCIHRAIGSNRRHLMDLASSISADLGFQIADSHVKALDAALKRMFGTSRAWATEVYSDLLPGKSSTERMRVRARSIAKAVMNVFDVKDPDVLKWFDAEGQKNNGVGSCEEVLTRCHLRSDDITFRSLSKLSHVIETGDYKRARDALREFYVLIIEVALRRNSGEEHLRTSRANREDFRNLKGLYSFLRVVMARESGALPTWEGIRVVREAAT